MRRQRHRNIVTDACDALGIKPQKLFAKAYVARFGQEDKDKEKTVRRDINSYFRALAQGRDNIPDYVQTHCAKLKEPKTGHKGMPPPFIHPRPALHA